MNLSTKQKQSYRHREKTCASQGGEEWKLDRLGICNQQMQTIIYRMDIQHGLTAQHREQYLISWDKP